MQDTTFIRWFMIGTLVLTILIFAAIGAALSHVFLFTTAGIALGIFQITILSALYVAKKADENMQEHVSTRRYDDI